MINHARTLLLNRDGSDGPWVGFPGEQFVPTGFHARFVPHALAMVRSALFGASPDRAMLNHRLQELLTCVHACGLGDYATALDPRVTYWSFDRSLFTKAATGLAATKLTGAADQQLFFASRPSATAAAERLYSAWLLEVIDGTNYRLTSYADGQDVSDVVTSTYSLTSGLSSVIPLTLSQASVRFTSGAGASWRLEHLANPARPLADLAADLEAGLGPEGEAALFPDGSPEPYATFRTLWLRHDRLPFRLAGLTLALAYRMNELGG